MRTRTARVALLLLVVGMVVGSSVGPLSRSADAAVGQATSGSSSFPVEGINIARAADKLVVYTRLATQSISPTNEWGAEAAVVDGIVTEIRDRQLTGQAGMPIPAGTSVLSGHGTARSWLLGALRVGSAVTFPGSGPSASPTPSPSTGTVAILGAARRAVTGTNIARGTDSLVVYTRAAGATSPANRWGAEVGVRGGAVIEIRDRQTTNAPAMPIPTDGYVLSGHGTSRAWLLSNAALDTPSSLADPTPGPTPGPTPSSCSAGYVRLTFDDGPHPDITPQILDTLRARGVAATFFVIGEYVAARPDLVRRETLEGHKVANHTWNHPYLTQLTAPQQQDQFRRTTDAIVAAGAPQPVEWRPPYEDWNVSVRDLAATLGMSMALWNYETDSNDWKGGSAETITNTVVGNAHDGAVILMHDRFQTTATALPAVLSGLAQKGLCVRP